METKESGHRPVFFATHQLFSCRYLLETDIFRILKANGVPIVVINPNGDNPNFRQMYEDDSVVVEKYEYDALFEHRKSRLYQFFVKVRHYTLPSGQDIGTLRILEADERLKRKKMRFSKAVFTELVLLTARLLRESKFLRQLFVRLDRMLFRSDSHQHLFERYKPALLVTTDIGTIEMSNLLIAEAQAYGVKVVSLVISWDNPTSKGISAVTPDWVITWNETMKDELIRYHDIDAARIHVGGIAHFDDYFHEPRWEDRDSFLRRHQLSHERKTLFYGTNTPGLFRHNKQLLELILSAIADNRFSEPCQLLLRLHPAFFTKYKKNFGTWWREFDALQKKYGNLLAISRPLTVDQKYGAVQPIKDQMNLAAILNHCDIMINMFSTLMLEACIFDLPVVNVGFYQFGSTPFKNGVLKTFTHIKRVVDSGAVRIAYDEKELFDLIEMYLQDRTIDHAQRMQVRENVAGPNKGEAAKAIAGRIRKLARYSFHPASESRACVTEVCDVENGRNMVREAYSKRFSKLDM